MSFQCLKPRIAYQEYEGQKPKFFHLQSRSDYEFYSHCLSKKYKLLLIPCGKCPNCLRRKSQEWTSRILKEKENFNFCYFITLTYDDEHLKDINKRDLQLFLKRYRKALNSELKYYITGEYGEITKRSHYHAIFLQNKPITDLNIYGNNLFISEAFNSLWKNGNCLISKQVNESSIKYTIAYTLKKLGESKIVLMSKGLGLSYLNDNKDLIKYQKGFYLLNGYKQPFLSYFKRKLKESSSSDDLEYLEKLENEPKGSIRLSGHYLGDLLNDFFRQEENVVLKGKGVF